MLGTSGRCPMECCSWCAGEEAGSDEKARGLVLGHTIFKGQSWGSGLFRVCTSDIPSLSLPFRRVTREGTETRFGALTLTDREGLGGRLWELKEHLYEVARHCIRGRGPAGAGDGGAVIGAQKVGG